MEDIFEGGLGGFADADGAMDYEVEDEGGPADDYEVACEPEAHTAPAPQAGRAPSGPQEAVPDAMGRVLGDLGAVIQDCLEKERAVARDEAGRLEARIADRDAKIADLAAEVGSLKDALADARDQLARAQGRLHLIEAVMGADDSQVPWVRESVETALKASH
ncbi:hypothetical protein [Caniella muris]|uniref:hypothetical protein n=1 Tax=Caniella muris TaxID=2941502 RepID=UPI00203D032D|nr:hypothetical protein [Caniella muris]